jgi:DNA-binding NarL/FixJ family response regulator
VGYRAFPELLQVIAGIPDPPIPVESLLRKANDVELSETAGLSATEPKQISRSSLTQREFEVLELLTQGMSNNEIAKRLFISLSTVKVHVHHILKKTGARTRLDAAMKSRAGLGQR